MADVMKYLIYVLPFVLAACSTANQAYYDIEGAAERYADPPKALVDYGRCPTVTVVEELGYVSEYMNASAAPRLKSRAYMEKGDSTCLYEDRSVSVDVTLDFHGQLGDKVRLRASDDPLFSYPFFVAITDRGGKIMAKQILRQPSIIRLGKISVIIVRPSARLFLCLQNSRVKITQSLQAFS